MLDNPHDSTIIHVLFGNKSEEDILMKPELEGLKSDPRVKIYFTVDVVRRIFLYLRAN